MLRMAVREILWEPEVPFSLIVVSSVKAERRTRGGAAAIITMSVRVRLLQRLSAVQRPAVATADLPSVLTNSLVSDTPVHAVEQAVAHSLREPAVYWMPRGESCRASYFYLNVVSATRKMLNNKHLGATHR